MPVRKFRSVEEMDDGPWHARGPALWAVLRQVHDLGDRTRQLWFPPGVYKHRSWEDAEALEQQWEDDNFLRHQERRRLAKEQDKTGPTQG